MYSANKLLELKLSVSPAITHKIVKKYQYHVENTCFKNAHEIGVLPLRFETSGTREIANAFSDAVK
jgi:hypothetical protein